MTDAEVKNAGVFSQTKVIFVLCSIADHRLTLHSSGKNTAARHFSA